MSNEKGENKRIVKKPKKSTITMNIKVSTQDKDIVSKNNKISEKNAKTQKSSSVKYIIEKEEFNIFHQTSILLEELKFLNSKINENAEKDVEILDSLNSQISELEKEEKVVSKKNFKLMSNLRKIEKNVSKKFSTKFKTSKFLSNQKKKEIVSEDNINLKIKSKDLQIEIEQKNIKYNKKEVEKLENLLQQAKDGMEQNLDNELIDLNEKIKNSQIEIEKLNKIKKEHQNCDKSISILKGNARRSNCRENLGSSSRRRKDGQQILAVL